MTTKVLYGIAFAASISLIIGGLVGLRGISRSQQGATFIARDNGTAIVVSPSCCVALNGAQVSTSRFEVYRTYSSLDPFSMLPLAIRDGSREATEPDVVGCVDQSSKPTEAPHWGVNPEGGAR